MWGTHRRSAGSVGDEDRARRAEAEALLGRLREVELAGADVRAAVDDARVDDVRAVAQHDPGAARQRLVRDADRAGGQRAAARQMATVEAGAVPRREGGTEDV